MTCGISVDWERAHYIKTTLPNVYNTLIKANFKDLITFGININFIQMFEINMQYEIKIIFEMLQWML